MIINILGYALNAAIRIAFPVATFINLMKITEIQEANKLREGCV